MDKVHDADTTVNKPWVPFKASVSSVHTVDQPGFGGSSKSYFIRLQERPVDVCIRAELRDQSNLRGNFP